MGGSGESGTVPVERANDIHVIPQSGCCTSTATRSLLHVPSSAPSTAGWSRSPGVGPALPARNARGWGAAGGGLGVLQVGGAFVQYAQPSTSGARPSWSRSAQGGSLGADVAPMACVPCAGSARAQTEPGLAARPCRLRFRWRQVSTALTLPSPTSEPPTGIVGMPRFVFGAQHRSGVDVSTMDTSAPPRRARPRPSTHRRPQDDQTHHGLRPERALHQS